MIAIYELNENVNFIGNSLVETTAVSEKMHELIKLLISRLDDNQKEIASLKSEMKTINSRLTRRGRTMLSRKPKKPKTKTQQENNQVFIG